MAEIINTKKRSDTLTLRQDEGVVVLGKRGTGKSTLCRYIINECPKYKFVIVDVVGNFKQYKGHKNVEYYLINPHNKDSIDMICNKVNKDGNCMVVLDEADRLEYTDSLSDLVNVGRNYGIGYIATARRTANIHKDYLSNQKHAFIFKHTYPRDVMVLKEWLNLDDATLRNIPEHKTLYFREDELIMQFQAKDKAPSGVHE